jgi:hypothetical protein
MINICRQKLKIQTGKVFYDVNVKSSMSFLPAGKLFDIHIILSQINGV